MAGWSAGAALAARRRLPVPGVPDLVLVPALWIALPALLGDSGHWLRAGVSAGAGLLAGFLISLPRAASFPGMKREAGLCSSRFLSCWKRFAIRMGSFQGRLILGLFYFTVMMPFSLLVRLAGDPLALRRKPSTGWSAWTTASSGMPECRRQF